MNKKYTKRRTNGLAVPAKDFKDDTLIVVHDSITNADYTDPLRNPVTETHFTGSGKATILQGTDVIKGTWKKKKPSSTVQFTDADGDDVPIKPGRVWVEL